MKDLEEDEEKFKINPEESKKRLIENLEQSIQFGAGWFFWIAGISALNALLNFLGSRYSFVFSLVNPIILDMSTQKETKIYALLIVLILSLTLALLGILTQKKQPWALMFGIILYTIDGFFLIGRDWVRIAFHLFVLFILFNSFEAARLLKEAYEIKFISHK